MFVSIDIGGTNTRVASSKNLLDIDKFEMFSSQATLADERAHVEKAITKVTGGQAVQSIAVGIAGILDVEANKILKSPNYSILDGIHVSELLGKYAETEFVLINDTRVAALGEAVLGAGAEFNKVAFLALGTGVGGALIVNKTLDNTNDFEPGHQIVNFDDTQTDGLGINGTIETYISGTAFKKIYKMQPHECNDPNIWTEYGKRVAVLVNNVIFMWNPDCIVIGGGMSKHYDKFAPVIGDAQFNKLEFLKRPKVVVAKFGQGSGITGGFVLLHSLLKN